MIDDYLPCKYGKPVFARGVDEEVWTCLLEKAWAKLHGNYAKTEGGLPIMASQHIHGVPSKVVVHKRMPEADEFRDLIKSCDAREYSMIAATYGQGENKDENRIISGHAYSVISYHEGAGYSLVKLRNPWGQGEWNGDWSDKSDKWTP